MKRLLMGFFCILVPASIAFAESAGPQRKMTETEASAYDTVLSTVKAALPSAPEGYSFLFTSDLDDGMVPQSLQPGEMLRMVYKATYKRKTGLEDTQMAVPPGRFKGTPEQQKRMFELNVREAELRKARDQDRSYSEKDKIRTELRAVRAEQASLADAIAAGKTESTSGPSSLPSEFSIWVGVNADLSVGLKATPCTITGAPMAFEMSDGRQNNGTHSVTVFLGAFEKIEKAGGPTLYQARNVERSVPTQARAIALNVRGPRDMAGNVRELAGKINMAKLQALLP